MDPQHFIELEGNLKNLKVLSLKHKQKIWLRTLSSQMVILGKYRSETFVLLFYRHEWDCQGREKNLKEEENERKGRMLYIVVELRKVEAILIT